MSQFRPPKRGGAVHYRHQGGGNRPHKGGQSRLRSRDAEQHLFSPSNRSAILLIISILYIGTFKCYVTLEEVFCYALT